MYQSPQMIGFIIPNRQQWGCGVPLPPYLEAYQEEHGVVSVKKSLRPGGDPTHPLPVILGINPVWLPAGRCGESRGIPERNQIILCPASGAGFALRAVEGFPGFIPANLPYSLAEIWDSPSAWAWAMACIRLLTPSLRNIFSRCVFTVLSEIENFLAIS